MRSNSQIDRSEDSLSKVSKSKSKNQIMISVKRKQKVKND